MEYNDTTCSMYTLLIKWGCTPSKESNIVLVWCDCFVCPRTFEKLVPTPLAEFQGWGPTLFFCSKLCAIENCTGRFRDWFLFFFMFFSSLPGRKISCDVPEMGWSQKMIEGWFASTHDLCQLKPISRRIHSRQICWHLEAPAFGTFCNEIQWLRSPYYPNKDDADNTVLVLVLLFPRFTINTRQRKTFF